MILPVLEPMLAVSGTAPVGDRWSFEVKWDGWRALVYVDDDIRVRSRTGRNLTTSLPELAGLADVLEGRKAIIDGELIACRDGAVDFYALAGRMSASTPDSASVAAERMPVTFVAFDLLWLDGDLTVRPLLERKELLDGLGLAGPSWTTNPWHPGDGQALFGVCVEQGHEGMVAKWLDSRYLPGRRSRSWLKVKCPEWLRVHAPRRRPA